MSFEQQAENVARSRAESRESGAESDREKAMEQLEKKMGAKERAEKMLGEVKSTQKQMQNISANMQQVVKAVQLIRQQLQLANANSDDDIPSVGQDQKVLAALQKKMFDFKSQLTDLRTALLQEELKAVREEHSDWTGEAVQQEAERRVEEVLKRLESVPESKD